MGYFYTLVGLCTATFFVHWSTGVRLYKSWKHLLKANAIFMIVGSAWDSFALWAQHWVYPPGKIVMWIGIMPLEDYLFIIIVPYFAITVYKVLGIRSEA